VIDYSDMVMKREWFRKELLNQ